MSFGEIYGRPDNPRTLPSLAVAKELGLDLVLREPNTPSREEYLKLNPQGLIPTFVGADGFILTESTAIVSYVASQKKDHNLLGKTAQDLASINRWLSYSNTQIAPNLGAWFNPIIGRLPYNEESVRAAKDKSLQNVGIIAKHLQDRNFLVGDHITIADYFVASQLSRGFAFVLDADWRAQNPKITEWAERIYNTSSWKAVSPNTVFVEKAVTYPHKEGQ